MDPASAGFTPEQLDRSGRYHRPLYRILAFDLALDLVVLALFAFGPPGDWIGDWLDGMPFWAEGLAWPAMVMAVSWLLGLPLAFWRGYVHEHRWGFSTQSRAAWVVDRLKGLAIGLVLTSGMLLAFVSLARALPRWWPVIAAIGSALVVLVLSFVGPVLLEPVFNRFRPLPDEVLRADLRGLSVEAGVPVRDVLVSDASRRTRKENAYVSGLGGTRRVVLFDTLLARNDPAYLRLVVAHELGHRRLRHVALGTLLAMAGAAGSVALLWALMKIGAVLHAVGVSSPADPRVVPLVLLAAATLQLLGMPLLSALSRRWESAADRFSLELTRDPRAFEESHRALALSNLSDLDPPRVVYLMAFSHPTPPERIAAARRWASELKLSPSLNPPTRS